jgi:hypothetical protein
MVVVELRAKSMVLFYEGGRHAHRHCSPAATPQPEIESSLRFSFEPYRIHHCLPCTYGQTIAPLQNCCERVVPLVHGWLRLNPHLQFMQDGAPAFRPLDGVYSRGVAKQKIDLSLLWIKAILTV